MVAEDKNFQPAYSAIECPVLVTERLVLRPPHVDDAADLAALANNSNVADMMRQMPHPYSLDDAHEFIDACAIRRLPGCHYAIARAENGCFIGCAALMAGATGLEVAYWIGEPFWGNGYATEVVHALVDLAFRTTDIETLSARCRDTNPGSRRVIQKSGFQYAGLSEMEFPRRGLLPVECFALDRRTWLSLRSWGSHRANGQRH